MALYTCDVLAWFEERDGAIHIGVLWFGTPKSPAQLPANCPAMWLTAVG
jgi:hypothetical protein